MLTMLTQPVTESGVLLCLILRTRYLSSQILRQQYAYILPAPIPKIRQYPVPNNQMPDANVAHIDATSPS